MQKLNIYYCIIKLNETWLKLLGNETSSVCPLGDVRLVGGITEREGQVEVCYDGQWGVVCPNGWDEMAANLVCTQLGYGKPGEGEGGG